MQLELFISGDNDAKVKIEIKGINFRTEVNVKKDQVLNIPLPVEAQVLSSEQVEPLGISIKSDNPITVYGLNRRFQTTDSFLCFPIEVLGKEYRAMLFCLRWAYVSIIVATENNTELIFYLQFIQQKSGKSII